MWSLNSPFSTWSHFLSYLNRAQEWTQELFEINIEKENSFKLELITPRNGYLTRCLITAYPVKSHSETVGNRD